MEVSAVYMDYQATTPLEQPVLDAIHNSLKYAWGNPSSPYESGKMAKDVIKESRKWLARMINSKETDIIFTSGGTECNNMVIHTAIKNFYKTFPTINASAKPHVITSNIEHDSIVKALQFLENDGQINVTYVSVSHKTGAVNVCDILSAIQPSTCLVSLMLANNETGILQPVAEVSEAVRALKRDPKCEAGILIHTDAGQAIGKVPVDVANLKIDYLTIVGHKFYAPRIGALYFNRDSVPLYPMLYGGGQEENYRPGTENTGMIAGLGKAAELVCLNLDSYSSHMKTIRDYLERKLIEEFPSDYFTINAKFRDNERIPNICNISLHGSGMLGVEILNKCKVLQASVGAACHTGQGHSASPVLLAIGVKQHVAASSIRLSVGRHTTKTQVDLVVSDLKQAVGLK